MRSASLRRLVALLSILFAAGALAVAPSAGADPEPVTCQTGQHLTGVQAGGLDVPAGVNCTLSNGAVNGPVTIEGTGSLITANVTLQDAVTVGVGGQFATNGTVIHGDLTLADAAAVNIVGSTITGSVTGTYRPDSVTADWAVITLSVVQGRIALAGDGSAPEFDLDFTQVGQGVTMTGLEPALGFNTINRYLILADSTDLAPAANPRVRAGSCGDTVHGDVAVHGATGTIAIGGDTVCSPATGDTIDGSLILTENTAGTSVAGTIGGDAVCKHDTPHPRADVGTLHVTVAGKRIEDCAAFPAA
jgi:hypothetical protein